ncbi:MAG: hypothetical protein ACK5V3_04925, partial [Bdellovibrionales bacterium]
MERALSKKCYVHPSVCIEVTVFVGLAFFIFSRFVFYNFTVFVFSKSDDFVNANNMHWIVDG